MPNENKHQSRLYLFAHKYFAVIILLFALSSYYVFSEMFGQTTKIAPTITTKTEPSVTETETITPTPHYPQNDAFVVRRIMQNSGSDVIYKQSVSGQKNIVRWGDELFFSTYGQYGDTRLHAYNLLTHEKRLVFEESQKSHRHYIDTITLLNNELYFSIGGYLVTGNLYVLTNPTATPKIVSEGSNQRIKLLNGRYFVVEGEGDACWGMSSFSLLDLGTHETKFITESHKGCRDGDEFIDFDSGGNMIMATHINDESQESDFGSGQKYTSVYLLSLDNPTQKISVVTENTLPEHTTEIMYSSNTNELVMIGETISVYSLKTNEIRSFETVKVPFDEMKSRRTMVHENTLCVTDTYYLNKNDSPPSIYEINLQTGTTEILTKPINCHFEFLDTNAILSYEKQLLELQNSLNLPSGYTISIEETSI